MNIRTYSDTNFARNIKYIYISALMPKSDCKKIFNEILALGKLKSNVFNEAGFFEGVACPASPHVVLQDGSVLVRKVASALANGDNEDKMFSQSGVISKLLDSSLKWLHSSDKIKTCVLVYDKPTFVTLAKCPEQRRRDSKLVVKVDQGEESNGKHDCITTVFCKHFQPLCTTKHQPTILNAPGWAWARVLNDRSCRPIMLKYLMSIAPSVVSNLVPRDKYLVVDTEGINPYVIHENSKCDKTCFANHIGEFDNCVPFWIKMLTCDTLYTGDVTNPIFVVDTIDTDLMLIGALFMSSFITTKTCAPFELIVCLKGKSKLQNSSQSVLAKHTFVHAGLLANRIHAKHSASHLNHVNDKSVDDLVATSVLAGSDFTSGFKGIAHKSMINAHISLIKKHKQHSLKAVVCAAIKSRFKKNTELHMPGNSTVRGQIARTAWTLAYWKSHFLGSAFPQVPDPTTHCCKRYSSSVPGWAVDSFFEAISPSNIKETEFVSLTTRFMHSCSKHFHHNLNFPLYICKRIMHLAFLS